jgi:prevent-host-death family protein
MAKRVSAAQAKAQLSELVARVAHGGERYVIERRGRPLAALVSLGDLECVEQSSARADRPLGALALVGAWSILGDENVDALVADIYAERARDTGRPVTLGD